MVVVVVVATKVLELTVVLVAVQEAGAGQQSLILVARAPLIKVLMVETCSALKVEVEQVVVELEASELALDQTSMEQREVLGLQALSRGRLLHELAVVVLAVGKMLPAGREALVEVAVEVQVAEPPL